MLTAPFFRKGYPEPLSTMDFAARTGQSFGSAKWTLARLCRMGAVKRVYHNAGVVLFYPRTTEAQE